MVHLVRRTFWHIEEGWDDLQPHHRREWLAITIGGMVALSLLTAALTFGVRALEDRGVLRWERETLVDIEQHGPLPFSWAIWLESPGNAVVLWPLILGSAGIAAWRRRPLRALTLAGGFAAVDLIVLVGWTLWPRLRPDFIAGGHGSPRESFSAFPSGHVAQTIVAYGLLADFWIEQTRHRGERILAISLVAILTGMIGYARLRLGAHWPTDIAGGALVGGAWLAVLVYALRRGEAERRV